MSAMNTYNRTAIDNDRLANIVYTPGYIPQTLISSVDFYTAIAATKVTTRALWERIFHQVISSNSGQFR